jgi:hypothetical protein
MADEGFRVDPVELAKLANSTLHEAKALGATQLAAQDRLVVDGSVFGNALPEAELHAAHQAVVEATDAVLEGWVSTLEADVDNLLRVAFRYKEMNDEATRRINDVGAEPVRKQ